MSHFDPTRHVHRLLQQAASSAPEIANDDSQAMSAHAKAHRTLPGKCPADPEEKGNCPFLACKLSPPSIQFGTVQSSLQSRTANEWPLENGKQAIESTGKSRSISVFH
jgi:hypothetical protein